MNKLEEYMNQDIFNPTYLFHGSPYEISEIDLGESKDSNNNENEDNAVFLTSSFLNASAYAFRNKLKEFNEHYSFSINNNGELPIMEFEVDNLPDDLFGYIYVFEKDSSMIKDNHERTTQYRCYHKIKPIDIIKVRYKDFEEYFLRNNVQKLK